MRILAVLALLLVPSLARAKGGDPRTTCLERSGDAAVACLADAATAGNADPAPVAASVRANCTDDTAFALGYLDLDDAVLRLTDACTDFTAALRAVETPPTAPTPGSAADACLSTVHGALAELRDGIITMFGTHCFVREARGKRCKRPVRDRRAAGLRARTAKRIVKRCGTSYAALGFADATTLVDHAAVLARHYAQFVYPPNDLGPSGEPGPFPVGVRTLELVDPTRFQMDGTSPRPVTTELWYPSTADAVAGQERYVVRLFNLDIAKTPTYRDVARAPGPFPVVLFSHGNGGIRFQSLFLAAHLASHGYVVASPDHYGNTFLDFGAESIAASAVNRPLDMRFVLDTLLAANATPGDFLAGALDPARIGMSGHSFGGYTTFALAGGSFGGQSFMDSRMRAFLPLAPATSLFPDEFFATITAPILIGGGSLDTTTPFADEQQRAFDLLPAGAAVVGLAKIDGAGHFTFSDICEVPRNLVGAIGGFDEACTPEHLPWRDAHDLVDYLALNFFDATLGGDGDALARLAPAALAKLDDLDYEAK